jgi:molecular chaperone GrpE (heat shock protein)
VVLIMNEALKRIKKNIHNYVIGAFLVLVLLYLLLNIATNDNSFFSIELLVIILLLLSLIEEASLEELPDNKTKTTSEKITEEVSVTDTKSDKFIEEISNMNKIITHLRGAVEKKEEEIERFKKGYDANIYRKFLLRFTRVDRVLKEYIEDETIDLEGLDDIHIQMVDALEECGVEPFYPEIGLDFKTLDNIADNPKRIPTNNKNQHETIAEVSQIGYLRRCEDTSVEIISQAKVVIYDYAEPEKSQETT